MVSMKNETYSPSKDGENGISTIWVGGGGGFLHILKDLNQKRPEKMKVEPKNAN